MNASPVKPAAPQAGATAVPLILNPAAGGGRAGRLAQDAIEQLRAAGWAPSVLETAGPGDASTMARNLAQSGEDTVLVAGGDGTTFEVINGLFPHDGQVPKLGFVPVGTGNSFLRDFGITDTAGAIAALSRRHSSPVDVVRVTHDAGELHYINLFSIGFTSEVGALTNRRFKALGALGYTVATVVEVARLKARSFPISVDGGLLDARPCTFLSFSNSRFTGGTMMMAPDADVADGRVDLIRIGKLSRAELLRAFPSLYRGEHLDHPANEGTTAARVDFQLADPVDVMVDGEVLPRLALRTLEVLPHALEVIA